MARRRAAGGIIWQDELFFYWSQINAVEDAQARYQQKLQEWQSAVQAYEDMQARVHGELEGKRQTLEFQMLSVRTLVAGLQVAEEDRLLQLVRALPEEAQTGSRPLLGSLRAARVEAEQNQDEPATYGSLLRQKWLKAHRNLAAWVRRATRQATDSASEPASE